MKRTLLTLLSLMLVIGMSAGNPRTAKKKISHPTGVASQYAISPKAKAKKAEANQTVDLYFTEYGNMSYTYYDDPGDWYFGCTDDSGNYIVRLDCLTEKENQFGTFTVSDLDPNYSYIQDFTGEEEVDHTYLEGTEYTISQEGYTLLLTGKLVCDNGVTYVLHGEIGLPEPQTYDIEGNELLNIEYYEEDNDWLVAFKSDEFKIRLDLLSQTGSFAGTYTQDDFYGENYAMDYDSWDNDYFTSLNVTMSTPEGYDDPNEACEITGTAVGESGNTYNFHFKLDPPVEPKETVDLDVNVDSAQWPSIYGGGYYELSEKNNPDEKWVLQYWNLTGEYDENGLNLDESKRYNATTGDTQTVLHGNVSQTFDSEAMKLQVKAELVMSDTIQYNINFETPIETKGEKSYSFTNLDLDNTYASWGFREITASSEQATINVSINESDVPGEYDDRTVSISLVTKDDEGNENYISTLTVLNASTTLDENDNAVFKARILGDDMYIYNIDACFVMPEVTDTLTITIDNIEITDYTENGEEAGFYLSGQTEDGSISVWMGVASTQIPGHYTIADVTEFAHGSGITFTDENWNQTKAVFYAGEFDVTTEGRLVCLKGDLQAGNYFVHLTLNGKTLVPGAIEYDNEDEGIEVSFTAKDLVGIQTNDDGAGIELQNANRNDVFAIVFLLDQFDSDITVPEGKYEVSQWGEKPSVQAGQYYEYSLYPSYYGTFDEDGYVNTPLWYLTYGTVTVENNDGEIAFEVNGQNSYYQTIHITYNLASEGIKDVTTDSAKVKKFMKDGKFVISKDGNEYNAVGQKMK